MKLAAIDIGSNAARLLITEVTKTKDDKPYFDKLVFVRVPLRLGFDVFEKHKILKSKQAMLLATMKAYQHLLEVYKIKKYYVVATSSLREARNAKQIIKKVKKETGIPIHVISGQEEASLLIENHVAEKLPKGSAYLYIDVGGGSTEVSYYAHGSCAFKKSFDIGTIRILQSSVNQKAWNDMRQFISTRIKKNMRVIAIGTGGNINKVLSICKDQKMNNLSLHHLDQLFKKLSILSVDERMVQYNLRRDRADVIVPALTIYIEIMRAANCTNIIVPKIGLADAIIQHLYLAGIKNK
ncbi:MAG: hypothetical protein QM528_05575 [Phycisphaerales bacterium]|nr:hypothetical protein [Phycisphaerales bacterium]